jgi:hypothetical protein
VKKFSDKLALASGVLLCAGLCFAQPMHAKAQGYSGLIPDDTPAASSGNSGGSDDGYAGVIAAPPQESHGRNAAPEPQGYAGVISGAVPDDGGQTRRAGKNAPRTAPQSHATIYSPATARPVTRGSDPGYTPVKRDPQVSYRPGFKQRPPALTVDDLKTLATLLKHGIDFGKLPESFEKTIHMPAGTFKILSHPQNRIDGMLPTEFAVKRMVDTTMTMVNNPILSPDERHKQAQAAIQRLGRMADGLRISTSIPQSIYDKMGAPDVYVQEQKEGGAQALKRLNDALYTLSQM